MSNKDVVIDITTKDKTGKGIKKAEKSLSSLGKVAKTVGPLITGALGTAVVKSIFDTTASFQKLDAMLKTATGSAKAANVAFMGLQDFAASTPFQLDQVVDAFVKMKNLGLDPTDEALTSFGNTAVAMGKDLNQMIEAVADAATGEFERLKEFGIKAKSEGDNVSFTFQGVTTTVKKNAEEITGFLQSLGTDNFGGAMAEQMNTINGAVSNLQDNLSQLFNLNKDNASFITDWLQDASFLIGELNRAISDAPIAERLGEVKLEILSTEKAIKSAREEASKEGGFFSSLFSVDSNSIISEVNLLEAKLEDLKRKRDGLQAEAPAADVADTRVVQNQVTLDAIREQEILAFSSTLNLAAQQHENRNAMLSVQTQNEIDGLTKIADATLVHEANIQSARQNTANLSVNLLSFLGQKNKGFAIAALALQKGLDISKVISAGAVAATAALPLGPGAVAAAKAYTATQVALIASLGIAQAAAGGGGSGPGGGSSSAPIAQPQPTEQERGGGGVTVNIDGNVIESGQWVETELIPAINAAQTRGTTIDVRG